MTLMQKLKKRFRKEQRKNIFLGFTAKNENEVFSKLPLDAYRDLNLTPEEIWCFKGYCGLYNVPLEIIPAKIWFQNCCLDLELLDNLSDEQVAWILNDNAKKISEIFFVRSQNRERLWRIWSLLNEESLEDWISHSVDTEFVVNINNFLIWTYQAEKEELEKEWTKKVFEKLATLSDRTVARLLESAETNIVKRILSEIQANRVKEIYEMLSSKKEDVIEILLENEEGRKILKKLLEKQELSLIEELVKTCYF